jgi:hypothetical protein
MIGASEDGSYVYFVSNGRLLPEDEGIGPGVYLWHNGQLRYITDLANFEASNEDDNWTLTTPPGGNRLSRVSPDGRFLLLLSRRSLTGYDTNGTRQFYLYDREDNSIVCVSCNRNALQSKTNADSRAPGNGFFGIVTAPLESRTMTADGRVFFDTGDPLVAQDTNGRRDVYEWSNGAPHLLSTGDGDSNSYFAEADTNGDNVFIYTRSRLVGWDHDDAMDIYDARVGGGLPEPPPGPADCQGDACQNPPSPPLETTPSSEGYVGPGNARHAKARRDHRKHHSHRRHHRRHSAHRHG